MITGTSNPLIREIQALNAGRKKRDETGLFTAEGKKIFLEAPQKLIHKVVVSETFEKENAGLLRSVRYETVTDSLFARISDTKTPQGILTVFHKPVYTFSDLVSSGKNRFILMLEDLQDPGNVGTIIRTAEGAGADGIILGKGCADVFQPKVIRSTMGSIFRVPVIFSSDLKETAERLRENGFTVFGSYLQGAEDYADADYAADCAVVIGNESRGMSEELAHKCDRLIRIPMEGQLESLNAGVAAALIMYAAYNAKRRIR